MPTWMISLIVFSGSIIGYAHGLKKRMDRNPELKEKGLWYLLTYKE